MKTSKVLMAVVALAFFAGITSADEWGVPAELGGSRSTADSDGVFGSGKWAHGEGGLKIDWTILQPGDSDNTAYPGLYQYTYNITDAVGDSLYADPEVSHWILETSEFVTPENWLNYFVFPQGVVPGEDVHFGDWNGGDTGNSNPGIPGPLHGIKFDMGQPSTIDYLFWSTQRPVYGDFYAKDGVGPTYAYNTGFGDDPLDVTDGDYTNWIATPDTEPGLIIPEPGLSVLALGALLVGAFARRRQGKGNQDVA